MCGLSRKLDLAKTWKELKKHKSSKGKKERKEKKAEKLMLFIHQPYFLNKSLVLFLMRVNTITTQARIHGGKLPPNMLNFSIHVGVSFKTNVIKMVITDTPIKILVTGLIRESCN